MKEIMDSNVNSSYSEISIKLLKILNVQEVMLIIYIVLLVTTIVHSQMAFDNFEEYSAHCTSSLFCRGSLSSVSNMLEFINDI
jgi:hypothetical protein